MLSQRRTAKDGRYYFSAVDLRARCHSSEIPGPVVSDKPVAQRSTRTYAVANSRRYSGADGSLFVDSPTLRPVSEVLGDDLLHDETGVVDPPARAGPPLLDGFLFDEGQEFDWKPVGHGPLGFLHVRA